MYAIWACLLDMYISLEWPGIGCVPKTAVTNKVGESTVSQIGDVVATALYFHLFKESHWEQ